MKIFLQDKSKNLFFKSRIMMTEAFDNLQKLENLLKNWNFICLNGGVYALNQSEPHIKNLFNN